MKNIFLWQQINEKHFNKNKHYFTKSSLKYFFKCNKGSFRLHKGTLTIMLFTSLKWIMRL